MSRISLRLFLCLGVVGAPLAHAVDFEKQIRPILTKNCYECHSETRKKEKAGYVFDNLDRFAKSIGVNLAIEPGNPGESTFYDVLTNPDAKHHMPPKGSLGQSDLDNIRKWISEGARFDDKAPKLAMKKDLPPIMKWTNSDGRSIKAGFGGVEGDQVIFKMPTGQLVKYPIAKLSPESQKLVKECAE